VSLQWRNVVHLPGQRWKIENRICGDCLFKAITAAFALSIVLILLLMTYEMIRQSLPSLQAFGWSFIWSREWDAVQENFGALTRFGGMIAALVELLAAIPSVIYGLWGVLVMAPWLQQTVQPLLIEHLGFLPFFQGAPYGVSMLAAVIILMIMVVPIITSIAKEVLLAVPNSQKEAAFGIGATRWEMIRIAVLPYARSGILGAVILGFGRAVGETMAVTMVIGNTPQISLSLLSPGYTMPSVIANEFAETTSKLHASALMEIGLILLVVALIINALARLLIWSVSRQGGSR